MKEGSALWVVAKDLLHGLGGGQRPQTMGGLTSPWLRLSEGQ